MSKWTRIGKVGFGAVRRGQRFRSASRAAAERSADSGATAFGSDVDTRLTPRQAALLIRYLVGKVVLGRLEFIFLLKYPLLVAGVPLLLLFPPAGIVLLVVFGLAALVQWVIARTIGRLAAFHRLDAAENEMTDAATVWWPNLKRETARVGLPTRPLVLLKLAAARATRRLDPEREAAFAAIDWRAVIPREQWQRARILLAKEAGGRGDDATA
ncbi:hypothetical protein [Embleya scabrispora]|uniref:hypothetical protein n=1 Tax=Embleya scabrispora TaxID=159449 RepID=UPI00037D7F37|nr:hypothetical protein [Embleya scabrispora]MYS87007.1 hypothetical protein [Streptomyces sp. SID5474]